MNKRTAHVLVSEKTNFAGKCILKAALEEDFTRKHCTIVVETELAYLFNAITLKNACVCCRFYCFYLDLTAYSTFALSWILKIN